MNLIFLVNPTLVSFTPRCERKKAISEITSIRKEDDFLWNILRLIYHSRFCTTHECRKDQKLSILL